MPTRWTHALVLGHSSEDLDTPVYFSRFGSARDSLDWIDVDGARTTATRLGSA